MSSSPASAALSAAAVVLGRSPDNRHSLPTLRSPTVAHGAQPRGHPHGVEQTEAASAVVNDRGQWPELSASGSTPQISTVTTTTTTTSSNSGDNSGGGASVIRTAMPMAMDVPVPNVARTSATGHSSSLPDHWASLPSAVVGSGSLLHTHTGGLHRDGGDGIYISSTSTSSSLPQPAVGGSGSGGGGEGDGGSPQRHLMASSTTLLTPTRSPILESGSPLLGHPSMAMAMGGMGGMGGVRDALQSPATTAWPPGGTPPSPLATVSGNPMHPPTTSLHVGGPAVLFPPAGTRGGTAYSAGELPSVPHMQAASARGGPFASAPTPSFAFGSAPFGNGAVGSGSPSSAQSHHPQQAPAVSVAQQPIGSGRRVPTRPLSGAGGDGEWGPAVHDGDFGYRSDRCVPVMRLGWWCSALSRFSPILI
jgi:hypothetical protein